VIAAAIADSAGKPGDGGQIGALGVGERFLSSMALISSDVARHVTPPGLGFEDIREVSDRIRKKRNDD